ncbi:hypothetical protein [Chryseobacterium polytrichastri]|uniref:Uncharacterized protein n=1 Tax=Chryseobacterium polytrichastri TaxID=1302687 RepID=A0A1M7IYF0_9FLAO|nr:hypothetical protein [Chryseobacterium polytrichastri]SHM45739.1 hypothetical protein SAMN05444267_10492 [Chryseobacterium polytrichastri]
MKYILIVLLSCSLHSQTIELTDKKLIEYYDLINKAENSIITSNLKNANEFYNSAFILISEPPAKDIYNSMQVGLRMKEYENSFAQYNSLKCLGYPFKDDFKNIFFNHAHFKEQKCRNKFDNEYKKALDSLYNIDQYTRKLSNRDYAKYQKELTKGDSIASLSLLKLIQKKGFPNEYNLGINMGGDTSFQEFYLIIWHQLITNKYSSQKVNFSEELNKALNKGKIIPENAAFLLDLNNGTDNFSSKHFDILEFQINNGSSDPLRDQVLKKTATKDCCYVHTWFFPENRNEDALKMVKKINENRQKIGLCDLDSELKKKVFYLKNKDYQLSRMPISSSAIEKSSDADALKKHFIKLNNFIN